MVDKSSNGVPEHPIDHSNGVVAISALPLLSSIIVLGLSGLIQTFPILVGIALSLVGVVGLIATALFLTGRQLVALYVVIAALIVAVPVGIWYWRYHDENTVKITFSESRNNPTIQDTTTFILAHVTLSKGDEATCQLQMIKMVRDGKALWEAIVPLDASGKTATTPNHTAPQQLYRGAAPQIFDVVNVYKHYKGEFQIANGEEQSWRDMTGHLGKGKYDLTVQTSGKNCISGPVTVHVRYDGATDLRLLDK